MDIVYFLDQDWDISPRRPHITALAKYARVLCLGAPVTIDTPLRKPKRFIRWLRYQGKVRRAGNHLYFHLPFMFVPHAISFKYPVFRGINRRLMRWNARRAVAKLGMKEPVVFIFNPQQAFEAGILGESLLCYEVVDEYSEYAGMSEKARSRMREEEKRLLEKADIVFAVSKGLCQEKSKLHPHVYPFYNTTDVAHFMKALDEEAEIPADIAVIPAPRIGFVGNINDIFDCGLINHLAKAHPEWSIVLIGKANGTKQFLRSPAFLESKEITNIHYLGWQDFAELPNYLKAIDVCLMPELNNQLTKYMHHNKIYQYLAAGKPVVATYNPEIYYNIDLEVSKLMAIARDYAEFERLVEEALQHNSPEQIRRRVEVAKDNSAEKRAEAKMEILRHHLSKLSQMG
ncbi:glycosyltransferase [Chloroflexota bacterium]